MVTHLVLSHVVLADEFLNLRWRQNPANVEQNIYIRRRRLFVRFFVSYLYSKRCDC